ncbi:MAG: hypothetical protein M1827_002941 [Pycnora praestabilis]|nr:MAG: hypothetical protein M1827_002941 [Pycnora praestabilis]
MSSDGMSGYNGRRAPNVSQYIANLNTIPSAHDLATQQQEGFNLEDDLAMFTNTQFFDYDLGQAMESVPVAYSPSQEERARRENAASQKNNMKGADFLNGEFQFPDFSGFQNVIGDGASVVPPLVQTDPYPKQSITSSVVGSPTSALAVGPDPGEKRNADSMIEVNSPHNMEDASRMAAEEDKRRRNTAASARFRVKKKQREQALEKSAKEMTDRASALEARINQLETENKWLKNLVMEKNGNKDDIAELWREFKDKNSSRGRSTSERKDGVGTTKTEDT